MEVLASPRNHKQKCTVGFISQCESIDQPTRTYQIFVAEKAGKNLKVSKVKNYIWKWHLVIKMQTEATEVQ